MTRIDIALRLQVQRRIKAFFISLCLGTLFSWTQFSNESVLLHMLVAGLASYLIYVPLREFFIWKTIREVYNGDIRAMKADAAELEKQLAEVEKFKSAPAVSEINLEIVATSTDPIGSFKDFQYYENITVKANDGTLWLFKFNGTMDIDGGIAQPLADDELLLYPGIIYKCVEQVKNPT